MEVKIRCVWSLTNAKSSFKFVFEPLMLPIFNTFSVNSQNTFLSADFCVVLLFSFDQTCSRTIVYMK